MRRGFVPSRRETRRIRTKLSHPEMAASLDQQLTRYLDGIGAETVNQLTSWLADAEKRVATLRPEAEAGAPAAQKKLAEAEKYVTCLKEQVVFTRERMALNEE